MVQHLSKWVNIVAFDSLVTVGVVRWEEANVVVGKINKGDNINEKITVYEIA